MSVTSFAELSDLEKGQQLEMDIMASLVQNIAQLQYEKLPPEAVHLTKRAVIDTLGALLAGTAAPEGRMITEVVKEWGGRRESTVVNGRTKVPVHHCALANCTMARVMDLDNVLETAALHVHGSIVPSALAMAEKIGRVKGKDVLAAVVLGADLLCRLGLSTKIPTAISGMNATFQFGTFGVAATCGRLLALDKEKLLNAMGIAYSLTSGNSQCLVEGAMTARLGQGTCAQAGVLAALLAQKGFTGAQDVLEGKFGYFRCYQGGEYDPEVMTRELGTRFEGCDLTFKLYPCCTHTHAAIDGTLHLLERYHLAAGDIKEIRVGLNQQAVNLVVQPCDLKVHPQGIAAAQFSLPFTVGTAVVKKKVFIDDFTEKEVRNPQILQMARKVRASVDPEIEKAASGRVSPAHIGITTHDGKEFQEKVDFIKGSPQNPLSLEGLIDKFKRCNSFARNPLSTRNTEEATELILNLEQLPDLHRLTRLLG